jgi:DNA (cytosine-5)-methyltransferase 1
LRASGGGGDKPQGPNVVAHSLRGEGFDASEDGTGRGTPLVPVAFAIQAGALRTNPNSGPDGVGVQADHAYTLEARAEVQAVAFDWQSGGDGRGLDPKDTAQLQCCQVPAVAHAIRTAQTGSNGWGVDPDTAYTLDQAQGQAVQAGMAVRRLTPRECEALQGFSADYTRIPWRNKPASECPDGPRYRALGNSWAVPCAAWIGARIAKVVA